MIHHEHGPKAQGSDCSFPRYAKPYLTVPQLIPRAHGQASSTREETLGGGGNPGGCAAGMSDGGNQLYIPATARNPWDINTTWAGSGDLAMEQHCGHRRQRPGRDRSACGPLRPRLDLFYGDGLGQVARLVHVAAPLDSNVIRQQL